MSERLKAAGLTSLNVTCTTSACENGLHVFKPKEGGPHPAGCCRDCGCALVDWGALHARDREDLDRTIDLLQHEAIRHVYWCEPLAERARKYALRKGLAGLRYRVPKQLQTCLALPKSQNPWDGRQTKTGADGNAIHWAQHATATCCRVCVSYWHGIDVEANITDEDYAYFAALVMTYLERRLPEMGEEGIHQPRMT